MSGGRNTVPSGFAEKAEGTATPARKSDNRAEEESRLREKRMYRVYSAIFEEAEPYTNENPITDIDFNQADFADYIGCATGGLVRWTRGREFCVWDRDRGLFSFSIGYAAVSNIVECFGRLLLAEAGGLPDGERKAPLKLADKILTANGNRDIMALLERNPFVYAEDEEFDADKHVINCLGLVYDFRDGTTRDAAPGDMFTRTTSARPDFDHEPVKFSRFMDEISCDDREWVRYNLTLMGYAASGDTSNHILVNCHGGGGNGKGTQFRTVAAALGDYAGEIPQRVVVTSAEDRFSPTDQANVKLLGLRLAYASDVKPGKLNMENLKAVTGGDKISGKILYKDSFMFRSEAKIFINTNHVLSLPTVDNGDERRMIYIPYDYRIPRGKEDPKVEEELLGELPQILGLILLAGRAYYVSGRNRSAFPECKRITDATREYLESQDVIGQFLEARTKAEEEAQTGTKEMYMAYRAWYLENVSEKPWGKRAFSAELAKRKIRPEHTKKGDVYKGIGLSTELEKRAG